MNIFNITSEKNKDKIQRLAAYCRVSSDSEDQLHSFAAQYRYYADYEKNHPEVRLVDIYADEGISGTSLKHRDEMNRLISDCEQGKIDRIIVKSVSRFARNTEDLLHTLRLLKTLGVTVLFEEQGIDTAKLNSELFITFPGMIAQKESECISGNVRWSIKKRMESGEFNCNSPAIGFDMVDGVLVVNEREAIVVKRIFDMYLHGIGKQKIAETLNAEGVPKKGAKGKWHHAAISYILNNERYMGDALLQKRYRTDTLPYKRVVNKGERPKYYVENSNPAIITKETFEAVQRLQIERSSHRNHLNKCHVLTQKLFCPICNRSFRKLESRGISYWVSTVKSSDPCKCIKYRCRESEIYNAFSLMTFKLKDNLDTIIGYLIKQVGRIQVSCSDEQDHILELDKQIAQFSTQNHMIAKLHNNGILNSAEYEEQSSEIERTLSELRTKRRTLLHMDNEDNTLNELKELYQIIDEYEPTSHFDNNMFDQIVKRIEIYDSNTIHFKLLGNVELNERMN